jgi:protein arginine N-methyltransferase 1
MSTVIDEHRQYLADRPRLNAYRSALLRLVRPTHSVLDLGAGTGVLGLLACRAGAKRVTSIDEGGMIEVAREISRANSFDHRMVFLKGLSTRVPATEKFDVVVADQVGRFGFEAGIVEYFEDAARRFLRPGGVLIPSRIRLQVAAVRRKDLRARIDFWKGRHAGFDFSPVSSIALNSGYPIKLRAGDLLSDPGGLTTLELGRRIDGLDGEAVLTVTRPGAFHGIGGWILAELAPGVTMTTSPLSKSRIDRTNVFFPVERPLRLSAGDRIRVRMNIRPIEKHVSWQVEVWTGRAAGRALASHPPSAVFSHSTFKGMLFSREDLLQTAPGHVPRLTEWGVARRTLLELCDGRRTLLEIERELYRRHRAIFPSRDHVGVFVTEVLTRYGR